MSNTNNLTDYVLMPGPDYQDMCNAIREKTGIAGDIISSQIGNIIRSIQGSVVLPTHTVNFYNDTTLLQSYTNVVYGSTVIYTGETPTKASTATMSYTFDRFKPSGARITGDTNCYAQFIETAIEPEEPEEPETDTNWVLLCADGTTWSGEEVSNNAMLAGGTFETIDLEQVVTNQYRLTVDGTAYLCVDNGTGGSSYIEGNAVQIEGDDCPAIITAEDYSFSPWIVTFNDGNAHTLKVEVWIGSEPYVPEGEGYVPTDGYQAFTTDGTWTGEEVTTAVSVPDLTNYKTSFPQADIQWNGAPSATISNDTVVLIWVDNVCYTCSATVIGNPKTVYCFTCDGCPAAVMGGRDVGSNHWRVAFTTAGTYKLKVEVKI